MTDVAVGDSIVCDTLARGTVVAVTNASVEVLWQYNVAPPGQSWSTWYSAAEMYRYLEAGRLVLVDSGVL